MTMSKRIYLLTTFGLSFLTILGLCLFGTPKTSALSGSSFNKSHIIDDSIFFNSNTLNTGDIQNFLNSKVTSCDTNGSQPSGRAGYATRADWGSANGAPPPYICLKDYSQAFNSVAADAYCGAIAGGTKSAADIIFNVARACGVNPQTLIVLLQKEESLITDVWPWPTQYRIATGYGCPDTAPCDEQYYGFFNQVYNAGRQFRRYVQQPQLFNYAAGRTSFIGYNPNSACGGTNVTIQNGATAALYNYTPYQPNASALNNLYGTGDSCGAYGNRNFWRMFNDWFGPTVGSGYTHALNEDDDTQWVIFNNIKQYIPSAEVIQAWGLGSSPVSMSNSYLATIPSGPTLGRLMHLVNSPSLYFVDGGKKYHVTSTAMRDAWGFTGQTETYVSNDLFALPQSGGDLTFSVKKASSPNMYMIDGLNGSNNMVLRLYSSNNIYHAWEGDDDDHTTVSDTYYDSIDNAVGAALTTTKITYSGSEYQVVAGQRMPQSSSVAALYPGVAQSISSYTFNRLASTSAATHLVRTVSSPNVYLLDNGTKHHIVSPSLLAAWSVSGMPVNIVNSGFVAAITNGSDITDYLADVSGQLYVIDAGKVTVPAGLDDAYRNTGTTYSATSTLMNLFSSTGTATGFVKGRNSPQVYLLDNSGRARHIVSPNVMTLVGGYQTGTTVMADAIVNGFPTAADLSLFVSDGGTEYVLEGGQKATVSSSIKSNWGLSNAQSYSDGTLSRFSSGGSLDNKLKSGNFYYYIRSGKAFVTIDSNIANAWAIDGAASRDNRLISSLLPQYDLTRFVRSSINGDGRVFVVNAGSWYYVTAAQRANLGGPNEPTMSLDPAEAPSSITDWTSVVVKDGSGKHYVIDGGTKRSFANTIIQNWWTSNGSLTVPTMTNGFLNLLPNNGTVERAIKGSAPNVYSAESATKRWILTPSTYAQSYAPFSSVSDQLVNVLPSGTSIP